MRFAIIDIDVTKAMLQGIMPELNWDSDEMQETPKRWMKMMHELTDQPSEDFTFTTFKSEADEMVIVDNIPFVTLCAHHLVPFIGIAHIGYVPNGKIAGLSKFARLVKWHCKGAWNQESLTRVIADELQERLDPVGVAVVMRAEHLCMTIRGVQTPGTRTTTSSMTGCFADHSKQARSEFLSLIPK
jgi:GTP cyclohydrolase I